MRKQIFPAGAAVTAIFAALAWVGPVQADDNANEADAPSKTVKYHASDVTTASGAEALYERIHNAAWHVCSDMYPANNGPDALAGLRCIRTLTDEAVKEVNSPRLTEVRQEREGYAPPS